ncbi:hypothetical protein BLOT_003700 [Blomia tropicalis]|nr:hypothetical protein BLOT_003700 [Blomia tropicalis]
MINRIQTGNLNDLEMALQRAQNHQTIHLLDEDEESLFRRLLFSVRVYCTTLVILIVTIFVVALIAYRQFIPIIGTVSMSIFITIMLWIGTSILTCLIETDFTQKRWTLSIMVILWLCAGIGVRYVQMKDITKINHMILLLYPIIGIDLFISCLIRDTQMIVSGWNYELTLSEHMIGSVMLYGDLVMLFANLLLLFLI